MAFAGMEPPGTSKTAIDVCLGEVEAALKGALKIKDRMGPMQVAFALCLMSLVHMLLGCVHANMHA